MSGTCFLGLGHAFSQRHLARQGSESVTHRLPRRKPDGDRSPTLSLASAVLTDYASAHRRSGSGLY